LEKETQMGVTFQNTYGFFSECYILPLYSIWRQYVHCYVFGAAPEIRQT
jgi:hypothetical protein